MGRRRCCCSGTCIDLRLGAFGGAKGGYISSGPVDFTGVDVIKFRGRTRLGCDSAGNGGTLFDWSTTVLTFPPPMTGEFGRSHAITLGGSTVALHEKAEGPGPPYTYGFSGQLAEAISWVYHAGDVFIECGPYQLVKVGSVAAPANGYIWSESLSVTLGPEETDAEVFPDALGSFSGVAAPTDCWARATLFEDNSKTRSLAGRDLTWSQGLSGSSAGDGCEFDLVIHPIGSSAPYAEGLTIGATYDDNVARPPRPRTGSETGPLFQTKTRIFKPQLNGNYANPSAYTWGSPTAYEWTL